MQRWLKFVKYLEGHGWKPHILTVEDGTYSARDEALIAEVPEGLDVYKTKSRDPFRFYNALKGKKDGSVSVAFINIDKDKSLIDRLSMYIRSNFFIPDARKGWIPYAFERMIFAVFLATPGSMMSSSIVFGTFEVNFSTMIFAAA